MLYSECRDYLVDKLKAAGIRSKVLLTEKALVSWQDSHVGAVIFDSETDTRSAAKKRFTDEQGNTKKRSKLFDRSLMFAVTIGEYTDTAAEKIFEAFLVGLGKGIYVDGNYVPIEIDGVDWVYKEDSILKAKIAVQVRVKFEGGLYVDSGFARLPDFEIVTSKE